MDSITVAGSGRGATLIQLWLLRARHAPPRATVWPLSALLWILSLTLWLGLDWLRNQPQPTFYWYALPDMAWYLVGALALAVLLAWCSRGQLPFARAWLLISAGMPMAILWNILSASDGSKVWAMLGAVAGAVYALAYLARGFKAMTGSMQPHLVLLTGLAVLVFRAASDELYVSPGVWVSAEAAHSDAEDSLEWAQAEPLLFAQSARVDAALARIEAGLPGVPDAFFVGFAGHGAQRVFAAEIKLAAQVVAQRYAASSRMLLLLNDERDLQSSPLASVTALRYALSGIAAKMDLEEDVLFLSLSSHGSQDWRLDVSNGNLPLADLSAAELAAMLQQSGIKWRIIVISACYAGGFIDALRDPYTIVLAAAAPDRTSFGCSDERDLTYFGEAFYRDALPGARSLREAFYQARSSIAAREAQEDVEPSQPQAHFGMQLERRLRQHGEPRQIGSVRASAPAAQ